MKWYKSIIICDFVSPSFVFCKKEGNSVVFFNGGLDWFICSPDRAKVIAKLDGLTLFQEETENAYKYARSKGHKSV